MSALGYNARTDSYVWLCDGPPLLARGMVAAAGSRCGRRLELPRRVLLEVGDQLRAGAMPFHPPEPWELVQAVAGREWQMLDGLAAGGIVTGLETRVLCPDHRLSWDDEEPGRPIKATLDEQLAGSLEDVVAATYARLGIPRG